MESNDKNGKKTTSYIKQYDDMSKSTNVNIKIKFNKNILPKLLKNKENLEKLLKLTTSVSTTNMHLFDANEKLKKYSTVNEIINDYYIKRLEMYDIRKKHILKQLEKELLILYNKKRYISEILNDELDLRKKTKDKICNILLKKEYDIVDEDNDFKYLLKMPMDSVNEENVKKLMEDYNNKNNELQKVKKMTIQEMWLGELNTLETEYEKYVKERKNNKDNEKKK